MTPLSQDSMDNNTSTQVCSSFESYSVIQLRGQEPILWNEDEYHKALKNLGVGEVDRIPVLSFEWKNLKLLKCQLLEDATFSGIILTSPRAVEACQKSIENEDEWKKFKKVWGEKNVFCVGPKTANEASNRLGLEASLDPKLIGDGHKLGAHIVSFFSDKNGRVKLLLPCSAIAKMYSKDHLEEAGFEVVINFVYDTIPCPNAAEKLRKGIANSTAPNICLVIFSPSNLDSVLPELKRLMTERDLKIIAIGPTTRKAIEDLEIPVWLTCPSPTPDGLSQALRERLS